MTRDELKTYLDSNYSDKIRPLDTGRYDLIYEINAENLFSFAKAIAEDENLKFDYICNIGGSDTGENLEAVYSVASVSKKLRLDFKVILPYENPEIESVQKVWKGANWHEREMWELFGINIKNHNDLKCFLLPEDWNQGHPMRKDWDAPDFVRFPEL